MSHFPPPAPPPDIFDRRLLRLRRARASADPLTSHAAAEIASRIGETTRRFGLALLMGAPPLAAPEKIGRPVQTDLSLAPLRKDKKKGLRAVIDEEALPFREGCFDLAASVLTLHWVNDLPGVLTQIRRALKPDGLFLAALFGAGTLKELRESLLAAESEDGGVSPHIAPFASLYDLSRLLQRAGFALPVADREVLTLRYKSLGALLADIRPLGGNVLHQRRSAPLRRSVLARAEAIYRERFADPEGRLCARFEIAYLTGWSPHESQPKPLKPGTARMGLGEAIQAIRRK